jgi:polar amino acid transport system substrate-binding protein
MPILNICYDQVMKLSTALSLILLALTIPAANAAPDLPAHLVCYDDIFQPFFMQESGKITGLNVDLIAEAGHRLGIAIEFRQIPFKRLELELSQGKASNVNCGFTFSRTEAREKYMTFGKVPIQPTEYTLFVRTEQPGIESLDDLAGKVIGVRSGFRLPDAIVDGIRARHLHIDDVGSDESNFKKLALKRVDAVLTNRDVGLYTLRELKIENIHPMSPSLTHLDTYMVFPKNDTAETLAAAFDRAFSAMAADGTIKRLREKYLGREE